MNWLRLYHEARTDKKLQALNDKQFRVWFNLLVFASEQEDRGTIALHRVTSSDGVTSNVTSLEFADDLLAVEVSNGDTKLLDATIKRLIALHIIGCCDAGITFLNFRKRQYGKPSSEPDRVASRVEAHRQRQRNADVTPDVTRRNAIDTDTERDTELTPPKSPKGDEYPAEFSEFWLAYPNKKAKGDAYQVWRRLKSRPALAVLVAALDRQRSSAAWTKDGGAFIPHPATWLRQRRWEDEPDPPTAIKGMPPDIAALPWNSARRLKWENDHPGWQSA